MQISEHEQDEIDDIVAIIQRAQRGGDIAPHVDSLVVRASRLLKGNPDLEAFVTSMKTTANAQALLDWSGTGTPMADSAWNRLADQLK